MELINVIKNFKIEKGEVTHLDKYGEGHINTTYLLVIDNKKEYIVQKINHHIFPNVEKLMNNISLVLDHLRANSKDLVDPKRQVMNIIKTNDDQLFYYDKEDDEYYRIYDFVTDSVCLQVITDKELFKESGIGFGKFALDLQTFDATKLYDVIPNFHNTKVRFEHFKNTVKLNKVNRCKEVEEEIKFVLDREKYVSEVIDRINDGSIKLRVTHNDTKLNNILLDNKTHKALCVIDLDTIMPGSLLYDFGDSIRFGCNPCSEDEKDLSKVVFNIDYFKSFAEGYLSEVKEVITPTELEFLPFGAMLMTFECGMRFLDDYLDGDNYFKVHYDGQNLDRCHTQFKLVKDMEENMDLMKKIVKELV